MQLPTGKNGWPKDETEWPKNIDEAMLILINILCKNWDEPSFRDFRYGTEEDIIKYHLGLGMAIRNNFGLWEDNNDLKRDIEETYSEQIKLEKQKNEQKYPYLKIAYTHKGMVHPDTASHILLRKLWYICQDEDWFDTFQQRIQELNRPKKGIWRTFWNKIRQIRGCK